MQQPAAAGRVLASWQRRAYIWCRQTRGEPSSPSPSSGRHQTQRISNPVKPCSHTLLVPAALTLACLPRLVRHLRPRARPGGHDDEESTALVGRRLRLPRYAGKPASCRDGCKAGDVARQLVERHPPTIRLLRAQRPMRYASLDTSDGLGSPTHPRAPPQQPARVWWPPSLWSHRPFRPSGPL